MPLKLCLIIPVYSIYQHTNSDFPLNKDSSTTGKRLAQMSCCCSVKAVLSGLMWACSYDGVLVNPLWSFRAATFAYWPSEDLTQINEIGR